MNYIEKNSINAWLSAIEKARDEKVKSAKFLKELGAIVAKPRRSRVAINLNRLDKITKEGDSIIVPGKVLGVGKISKSFSVAAVEYSGSAIEKLKKGKCNILSIDEALKAKNARIII